MSVIIVDIVLEAHKFQKLYEGRAQNLLVNSRDGRRIQLPLAIFRQFLTHQGVHGSFMVKFDANNKLLNIKRIK